MDEEDRYSNSSGESDRDNDNDNDNDAENENDNENEHDNENDADEVMEDADNDNDNDNDGEDGDGDGDGDNEEDNNEDDDDDEGDNDDNEGEGEGEADRDGDGDGDDEGEGEGEGEGDGDNDADTNTASGDAGSLESKTVRGTGTGTDGAQGLASDVKKEDGDASTQAQGSQDGEGLTDRQREKQRASATPKEPSRPGSSAGPKRPKVRHEALTANLYDIVPTMAAPQATSINAMAIMPDLRYWFTGGSDGYIRKFDGPATINGKLPLTVAQKHPFVDSVTKAGSLMSYWENMDQGQGGSEPVLSPVYSLAVHSQAIWLLSGLESGGINLQSVRHDEGKHIHCLRQHTNAVSVLKLAQDERSVLSGSWDKNIFDWCLDTGKVKRSFDGSAGQISSIELRPASGKPVPAGADEPLPSSTTISTNNGAPPRHEFANGDHVASDNSHTVNQSSFDGGTDAQNSPAHESLFGGSDAGSLFGETADGGGQPFGNDEDDYNGSMGMMHGHGEGGMDHSADMAMAGMDVDSAAQGGDKEAPAAEATQPPPSGDAMDVDSAAPPTATQETDAPHPTTNGITQPTPDQSQLTEDQLRVAQEIKQEDGQAPPASQEQAVASSPTLVTDAASGEFDPSQMDPNTFLSAAMDGSVRIWDRRVPNPMARIGTRQGVPPWCMSACWSPDGNMIYAGRRNGTVEEYDVRRAKRGWEPDRTLKFPAGSGAISAVKPMVNGRHLVCASHDILRLYDLKEQKSNKHSTVPFLIIPGPPRAGVISDLYVDPTSRFMLSAAGTRGLGGTCTEVLIGYEINVTNG